ncbi:hypothetical protein C2S51_025189 [Perilla frutescens var. frutescens]|nr:hypothetical protein C2S51_025189 [Perilla frutescens var. frutescens]
MVHFQDTSISGKHYLVITDDDQQPVKRGTRLRAREPLIGKYAWRQIVEGKTRWHDKVEFLGEFHHFDGYWEWTEDVLSRCSDKLHGAGIFDPVYASLFTYDQNTEVVKAFCEAWYPLMNTLLTSSGELSISLWDLHVTTGLPLTGLLCDEMVPRTKEITEVNKRGKLFVPASCKYLFHAYYLLGSEDDKALHHSVSIERWTKFWSRRKSRYRPLPLRKEKKSQRSKLRHNPSGEVEDHKEWTSSERAPLTELEVKENHQNETYLAVHLACWLCSFVLPKGDGSLIRPSVFKIASIMASGERMSLAVPVLASIYHGLNKISSLTEPPQGHSAFPIHFVYGWMTCYLRTHFDLEGKREAPRMVHYLGEGGARFYGPAEAHKRVHRAELVSWHCIMPSRAEDFVFIDDENASNLDRVLTKDIREASLADGLRYWRICLIRRSMAKACFPFLNLKKFPNAEYKKWWDRVFDNFLERNVELLVQPKPSGLLPSREEMGWANPSSKGKRKVDPEASVSSNADHHWKREMTNRKSSLPLEGHGGNDPSHAGASTEELVNELFGSDDQEDSDAPAEACHSDGDADSEHILLARAVTEFDGKAVFDDRCKSFLKMYWGELRDKLMRTSVDSLSSLRETTFEGLLLMKNTPHCFDLSHLTKSLEILFASATSYDEARSASSELDEEDEKTHEIDLIREELAILEERKKDLTMSLKWHVGSRLALRNKIHGHKEELSKIRGSFDGRAEKKLKSSKSVLEHAKKALEDQDPFI